MIELKEKAKMVLLAAGLLLWHAVEAESTLGTVVLNSNSHKSTAMYELGDRGPLGGKVYYVDDSGEHGLEAASFYQ